MACKTFYKSSPVGVPTVLPSLSIGYAAFGLVENQASNVAQHQAMLLGGFESTLQERMVPGQGMGTREALVV